MHTSSNYVRMGKHQCIICGELFDSGEILLNTRLHAIPESETCTGFGLCPEHKKLHEDGYVALVEITNHNTGQELAFETANRTGRLVHLRREACSQIFNQPAHDGPLVFVDQQVFDKLMTMAKSND